MDELKRALTQVAASLQVLGANTEANTKGIQVLAEDVTRLAEETARRNASTQEELQALRGTFASIEVHLVKLFEEQTEGLKRWKELEKRVEALERKQSPAA